jgi:hypothetical protein
MNSLVSMNSGNRYSSASLKPEYYYKCESGDKTGFLIYNYATGKSSSVDAADSNNNGTISTTRFKRGSASLKLLLGSIGGFNLPSTLVVGANMTFMFWVYLNQSSSSGVWLFRIEFNSNVANIYYRGQELIANDGTGGYSTVNSVQPVFLNNWRHMAVVFDSVNNKVYNYTDGVLYMTGNYVSPAGQVSISNRGVTHACIDCNLDDIRLYKNKALSASQIYSIYSSG